MLPRQGAWGPETTMSCPGVVRAAWPGGAPARVQSQALRPARPRVLGAPCGRPLPRLTVEQTPLRDVSPRQFPFSSVCVWTKNIVSLSALTILLDYVSPSIEMCRAHISRWLNIHQQVRPTSRADFSFPATRVPKRDASGGPSDPDFIAIEGHGAIDLSLHDL